MKDHLEQILSGVGLMGLFLIFIGFAYLSFAPLSIIGVCIFGVGILLWVSGFIAYRLAMSVNLHSKKNEMN